MEPRNEWISLVLGCAGLAVLLGLAGNWLGCTELAGLGWLGWLLNCLGWLAWMGCWIRLAGLFVLGGLACLAAD